MADHSSTIDKNSSNKGRTFPAEPLTKSEVRQLIRACSIKASTGVRNRALITVLYRGGLRLNEALSLFPKDLDHTQSTIRVLHGKGNKSRLVGIDENSWPIIEQWIDKRNALGINGRQRLFCTLSGKKINSAYIRTLLPRLARKAGIEKRVHAHGLRHTHAFELANEGLPIHVIKSQLGHGSIAETNRYIDHLSPQITIRAMKSRSWNL